MVWTSDAHGEFQKHHLEYLNGMKIIKYNQNIREKAVRKKRISGKLTEDKSDMPYHMEKYLLLK